MLGMFSLAFRLVMVVINGSDHVPTIGLLAIPTSHDMGMQRLGTYHGRGIYDRLGTVMCCTYLVVNYHYWEIW